MPNVERRIEKGPIESKAQNAVRNFKEQILYMPENTNSDKLDTPVASDNAVNGNRIENGNGKAPQLLNTVKFDVGKQENGNGKKNYEVNGSNGSQKKYDLPTQRLANRSETKSENKDFLGNIPDAMLFGDLVRNGEFSKYESLFKNEMGGEIVGNHEDPEAKTIQFKNAAIEVLSSKDGRGVLRVNSGKGEQLWPLKDNVAMRETDTDNGTAVEFIFPNIDNNNSVEVVSIVGGTAVKRTMRKPLNSEDEERFAIAKKISEQWEVKTDENASHVDSDVAPMKVLGKEVEAPLSPEERAFFDKTAKKFEEVVHEKLAPIYEKVLSAKEEKSAK